MNDPGTGLDPLPPRAIDTTTVDPVESASLAALLRRLLEDGRTLIQQEIALAGLEMRTAATRIAKESAIIAAGGFLIALGLLVLLVFVILALGRLLGGEYWLSTLIVGGVLTGGGVATLVAGRRRLGRDSLRPTKTLQSIEATRDWAETEARDLKRNLRNEPHQTEDV